MLFFDLSFIQREFKYNWSSLIWIPNTKRETKKKKSEFDRKECTYGHRYRYVLCCTLAVQWNDGVPCRNHMTLFYHIPPTWCVKINNLFNGMIDYISLRVRVVKVAVKVCIWYIVYIIIFGYNFSSTLCGF